MSFTKLVHGEEEATKALEAARAGFRRLRNDENMPTCEFDCDAVPILDAMVCAKLAPSKAEAKRLIQQGGVTLNDEKVTDINTVVIFAPALYSKKARSRLSSLLRSNYC